MYFQHLRDGGGAQHPLPLSPDSPDVALGEESLHPPPPQAPHHEEAHQDAQQGVGDYLTVIFDYFSHHEETDQDAQQGGGD